MELAKGHKFRSGSMSERAAKFFVEVNVVGSNKTHKCIVGNCGSIIAAKNKSNFVSHLRACHLGLYNREIQLLDTNRTPAYYARKKLEFIQSCVEMVTINGRPFTCLLDSGFQKIARVHLKELEDGSCAVNLNSDKFSEIKSYIQSVANKLTEQIRIEVQNKLLSLMVDIATKNNKSLLGISVQYILDGAIFVRSIGMIEMQDCHTAAYILKLIKSCLNKYCISTRQIISITSDNASNMISIANTFNDVDCEVDEG